MTKSIEQLILALTKECDLYKDYLEIATKKKDLIISGNVKELERITNIEQNMIVSMGKVDHIRNSIIGNLLVELNIESVDSLSELANQLSESYKSEVLGLKDKLEKTINDIKNTNELNSSLIKQSLDYIDFNMNLMLSLEDQGSTYESNASEKDIKKKSNLFDVKI
jgi:flagellar FlgN protein